MEQIAEGAVVPLYLKGDQHSQRNRSQTNLTRSMNLVNMDDTIDVSESNASGKVQELSTLLVE